MKLTDKKYILSYFLLAFIIRIIFVLNFAGEDILTPFSSISDPFQYDSLATNIVEKTTFGFNGNPSCLRPPLYSFFLATIYFFFGKNYVIVRIIQSLIGAFSVCFIYVICRKISDSITCHIAGIISSLYPFFIFFSAELLNEQLYMFLIILQILALLYFSETYTWKTILFAGILQGLSILCKPQSILMLLLIILWLIYISHYNGKKIIRKITFYFLISILICLSWSIRNYYHTNKIIFVNKNGGFTLYSNILRYQNLLKYGEDDYILVKDQIRKEIGNRKNRDRNEMLGEIEYDDLAAKKAFNVILNNPLLYIRYCFHNLKILLFENNYGAIHKMNINNYMRLFATLEYIIILLMSLGGIIRFFCLKKIKELSLFMIPVISSIIIYTLIYACKRYRITTIDPFLIIFASYLLTYFSIELKKMKNRFFSKIPE